MASHQDTRSKWDEVGQHCVGGRGGDAGLPGGEGIVIDSPAGAQGSRYNGGLRHQVHAHQVSHSLQQDETNSESSLPEHEIMSRLSTFIYFIF